MAAVRSLSVDDIVSWLVARVAQEATADPDSILLDEPFVNLGVGSLSAVLISGELEESLGFEELEPSMFWDYPTIEKLAEHLARIQPATS